jgi:hypothetical protein
VTAGPPLEDDFTSPTLGTQWDASTGTPALVNATVALTLDDVLASSATVNLVGYKQWVDVAAYPATAGLESVFTMSADDGAMRFRATVTSTGATMRAELLDVNGVATTIATAPFNATTMRFLQFRETGGRVFFEYGSSLATMTAMEAGGRPVAFDVSSLVLEVNERTVSSGSDAPGTYTATYGGSY